jgi:UDP-N-acetylmuramoyl-tripeptide--D-alanyl-D-alanine ligase
VPDTSAALLAIGRLARERLPDRVVGITGSVGKTSVKDMTAAALAGSYAVAASERSFNNELGVPITLANAPDGTGAVVVEMGARGIGHIELLCSIARPTVGVVTTVAVAHTELFGSIGAVVQAKGELVEALPADGAAVLNADNPLVAGMAERTVATVVTFGLDDGDVRAEDVRVDADLRPSFRVVSPWGTVELTLAVHGAHQVPNALAAIAAAAVLDVELDTIAAGVAEARLSPWRMELQRTPAGARVINDAYNANPASTEAALRSLASIPAQRRTAVLGLMAELGGHHDAEHRRIGAVADELGVRLIAVGVDGYGGEVVADVDGALAALGPLDEGDAVLVKGSRVAGLERLAAALVAGHNWQPRGGERRPGAAS